MKEGAHVNKHFSFEKCFRHMEKYSWRLDDVFQKNQSLDFSLNFIPKTLVLHDSFKKHLNDQERLVLNQITGKSYLNFFHFVEQFIIEETIILYDVTTNEPIEKKVLDQFREEEIKHQKLFMRVMASIDIGMKYCIKVVDFEQDTSNNIIALSQLAVLLFTYHLELTTQEHYVHAIRDNKTLNKDIAKVLQCHWLEESQHAIVDYLELVKLSSTLSESEKVVGMNEYMGCLDKLVDIFMIQADHDLESLSSILNRSFEKCLGDKIKKVQRETYINLFIRRGLVHKQLISSLHNLLPSMTYIFSEYQKKFIN